MAATFEAFLSAGDPTSAGHHVATTVVEILDRCQGMATARSQNMAYLVSLENIDKVRKRSTRRGDLLQANWCAHLHEKLLGK